MGIFQLLKKTISYTHANKIFCSFVACTSCGFDSIYNIGVGINGTLGYCHPRSGHCLCKNGIQCQKGYNTSAACTSCEPGYSDYPYCMGEDISTTSSNCGLLEYADENGDCQCMFFNSWKYFVFFITYA